MSRPRCTLCGGILYGGENQLTHEFSGRCLTRPSPSRERKPQPERTPKARAVRIPRASTRGVQKPKVQRAPRVPVAPRHEAVHGESRYTSKKWKCRCETCVVGHREYTRLATYRRRGLTAGNGTLD